MSCKIEKSELMGKITCPPNKSYTHRAIFLATLSDGKSTISDFLRSADTEATINACKGFGAKITESNSQLCIEPPHHLKPTVIDAKNSGTTIRIATAIASLIDGKTRLYGDSSLNKRPMKPLLEALTKMGAKCISNNGMPPLEICGKISGGEISIQGNISSQFISALMIIAPLTKKGIKINVEENLVSKPYLEATIASMRKFGVNIQTEIPFKRYSITPQRYTGIKFNVPSDFSSLAILLAAAVLVGKKLQIQVNFGELPQGDEVFIDILERLGVKISIDKNIITVNTPKTLSGGSFDLSNTPDLLPPLSILSLKCSQTLKITNVAHARLKETDRIKILSRELTKTGLKIIENEDGLVLESRSNLKPANFDVENDHRLFMVLSIVGMFIGNCTVNNPSSVRVSYPSFIEDMNKVGAKIYCNS